MSLQLFLSPFTPAYPRLAMGFEDGRVELWECSPGARASIEEEGVDAVRSWWEVPSDARDPLYKDQDRRWWRCWEQKGHNEAGEFCVEPLNADGSHGHGHLARQKFRLFGFCRPFTVSLYFRCEILSRTTLTVA